jgi:hypothetical protein
MENFNTSRCGHCGRDAIGQASQQVPPRPMTPPLRTARRRAAAHHDRGYRSYAFVDFFTLRYNVYSPQQSSICDRQTSCELTPQLPRRGSYHFRVSKTFITNNSPILGEVIQRISDSPGMRMLWNYFRRYSYQNVPVAKSFTLFSLSFFSPLSHSYYCTNNS